MKYLTQPEMVAVAFLGDIFPTPATEFYYLRDLFVLFGENIQF